VCISPLTAAISSGVDPKSSGCLPDSKTMKTTTFPLQYEVNVNGQKVVRNMKSGIRYSPLCNGFWGVYEGPIDSIMTLEESSGKVFARGVIRRFGMITSHVIKDHSGEIRACINPPFEKKYCTSLVQVNFS
jgi:hypothetical protein